MLVSEKELTNLKLKAIKAEDLKELAASVSVEPKGSAGDLDATVSPKDEIVFTFKKKTYTTISKVLIITK